MNDEQTRIITGIERIVLKDLSFETPLGQDAYTRDWQPDCTLDMNHRCSCLAKGRWEVVVIAMVTAKLEGNVAFLIEAQQAGVFTVADAKPEAIHRALVIDASRLIFPYLRETVENVALKGGFRSIGMQPPDFEAWYADMKQTEATATAEPESTE